MSETAQPRYVDLYPGRRGTERVSEACGKCGGTGLLEWTAVDDSRCWACHGSGSHSVLVSSVRSRMRRQLRRDAEYAQAAAEGAEEQAAAEEVVGARYPEVVEAAHTDDDSSGAYRRRVHAARVIATVRRDGIHALDSAVAEYRYMIGESASHLRSNRYRGECRECRVRVQANEGWVGQTVEGWRTYCSAHKPEQY